MDDILKRTVDKLDRRRRRARGWRRVVRAMAVIVVFCTTYALILPAITAQADPICGLEEHTHSEDCYAVPEVHIHSETCLSSEGEVLCAFPDCGIHLHESWCSDEQGELTCTLSSMPEHIHSSACLTAWEFPEPVLACGYEEHTHDLPCYPVEEEQSITMQYTCGYSEHTHGEGCLAEDGSVSCTVPEHSHEAACAVEGVDTSADVEMPEQWESSFALLCLSGNWDEDLIMTAKTQLGYCESQRNIILTDAGELRGYTRYGEKYGDPYASWNTMFLNFCFEYAGVKDFRADANLDLWLLSLAQQGLFVTPSAFAPEAGDIVFIDTDNDSSADLAGIAVEQLENSDNWRFIVGDDEAGEVGYRFFAPGAREVVGWCKLPVNPMAPEKLDEAEDTADIIGALPTVEEAAAQLLALNEVMDKAGYEAYLAEILKGVSEAREALEALDEEQKALAGNVGLLEELESLCAQSRWQQLPAMETDGGFISLMNAEHSDTESVENLQTATFAFDFELESYDDTDYGEARVRLEFVLPVSEEKAVFDLDEMPWLEESRLTAETRLVGDTETACQVLTGYKTLSAPSMTASVVPGAFSGSVAVKVLAMEHNEVLGLQISAALEHNSWEGPCETHQITEKLSIESQRLTVRKLASPEEMQETYEELLAQYGELEKSELEGDELSAAADELWSGISEKYLAGCLSDEAFEELGRLADTMRFGDLNSIAESGNGIGWMKLLNSGWFTEYSDSVAYAEPSVYTLTRSAAYEAARAAYPSDVQVVEEGGENYSKERAVYVSKTIKGTEKENVFDITLDIITQDIVTEVYKEPDMAVVIVMDISNTMVENDLSPGVSRYEAAMRAAENFIDSFQKNNLGASNIGFVAFNSHAYEIFPMSTCYTKAQATALKNTARTNTGSKGPNNPVAYADSHDRFTNIEAGLKRGYDLLNTVDNEHKYIVFLSDGFPTTYIRSGYTGYDTYDSAGSRFYDSVEKYNGKNRPCSYGTSYSNEAAIRARKMATTLKNAGATIFSVGVDIGGQTIQSYVNSFKGRNFTVVDRRNTNYEIGSASDPAAFKKWLGNSIGSGYYYDSTDTAGLNNQFQTIFNKIVEINAASSHLDWVASDPLPNMGVHEVDALEFIGFFDRSGKLVEGNLSGVSGDGWNNENTASFDTSTNTIEWDIKQSGYVSTTVGSITNYECTLTYRVRLKNENDKFEEYLDYKTNDTTTLTYRIIDKSGDKVTVSEQRTVDFPIPEVEGYLAELEFMKQDSLGQPLAGATFELRHDPANCGYCRGDGKGYVALIPMEATSGTDGKVKFTNIPSGHSYVLVETVVPEGYLLNGNSYYVTVAYDTLTVTVKDSGGNDLAWEEFIENKSLYSLPNTGGSGSAAYYAFGLLLTAAAVFMYGYLRRRKRRGEAAD